MFWVDQVSTYFYRLLNIFLLAFHKWVSSVLLYILETKQDNKIDQIYVLASLAFRKKVLIQDVETSLQARTHEIQL